MAKSKMKRQEMRSLQRQGAKVEQTKLSPDEQIAHVKKKFKPFDDNALPVHEVRLATFTNNDTIRVNEFGVLEAYTDSGGKLVVVLNPKSKVKSRSFGRK